MWVGFFGRILRLLAIWNKRETQLADKMLECAPQSHYQERGSAALPAKRRRSRSIIAGHVDYLESLFYRGGGHMPRLFGLELNRSRQQQQRTRAQLGLKKVSKDGRDV
jgi:hypothetical protein